MLRRDLCLLAALVAFAVLLVVLTRTPPPSGAPVPAAAVAPATASTETVGDKLDAAVALFARDPAAGDWDRAMATAGESVVAVASWPLAGAAESAPLLGSGILAGEQGEVIVPVELADGDRIYRIISADGSTHGARLAGKDVPGGLALLRADKTLPGRPVSWARVAPTGKARQVGFVERGPGGSEVLGFGFLVRPARTVLLADLVAQREPLLLAGLALPALPGAAVVGPTGELLGIFRGRDVSTGEARVVGAEAARASLDAMKQGQAPPRAYLGLALQPVDRDLALSFGLKEPGGALVGDVLPGSPAESAGIRPGDVILRVAGRDVPAAADLPPMLVALQPGDWVDLELFRSGQTLTIQAQPQLRSTAERLPVAVAAPPRGPLLAAIEPAAAAPPAAGSLVDEGGVVVAVFHADLAVASGPLKPGDRILEVDGQPVATPEEFAAALERTKDKDLVRLRVADGGLRRYLTLKRP